MYLNAHICTYLQLFMHICILLHMKIVQKLKIVPIRCIWLHNMDTRLVLLQPVRFQGNIYISLAYGGEKLSTIC